MYLFWHISQYELVLEALKKADRMDLVGFDKKCLIRPKEAAKKIQEQRNKNKKTEKEGWLLFL